MVKPTDHLSYDTKPIEYFQHERPEMLKFVPAQARRVLDVGCAQGAFGERLKRSRQVEVWGIEPAKPAAEAATEKLDRVIAGAFTVDVGLPEGIFDCIVFNDVLEHMLEPELALRYARSLLSPGGVVVASIPNIRYLPIVAKLMCRGEWNYTDEGILDKTHLRFFTRSSIAGMFVREGFAIESMLGINPYSLSAKFRHPYWWPFRVAHFLLLRKFQDMRFLQFVVVAKPTCHAGGNANDNTQ